MSRYVKLWKSMRALTLLTSLIIVFVFASPSSAKSVSADIAVEVGKVHLHAEERSWRSRLSSTSQCASASQEYSILEVRELRSMGTIAHTREEDGKVLAYILDLAPKGCVIVSPDTDIRPVIAYSFEGRFSMEDTPGNVFLHLVEWDMGNRLEALSITSESVKEENNALWESYLSQEETFLQQISSPGEWGPHLKTTWGQKKPYINVPDPDYDYNMYCPIDPATGARCVTGCGPTAMAQIINYWKYPSSVTLTDSDGYTARKRGIQIDGDHDTLDFPSFDELNTMLSHISYYDGNLYGHWTGSGWEYPTDIPEEANQDIPALCFASGILFNYHRPDWGGADTGANYTSTGTSVSIITMTSPDDPIDFPPLTDGFGYASAKAVSSSWPEFYTKLEENMRNGQPAMLSIDAQQGGQGHIVVADGFRDAGNYYHLNFGWGVRNPDPVSDAWYTLPEGMPDPGPAFERYNVVNRGVIDISPPPGQRNATPDITSVHILQLYKGRNLISSPVRLPDNTIEVALNSIAGLYTSVWRWVCDPAHAAGGYWTLYNPDAPGISDLKTFDTGNGYWIDMEDAAVLTLDGQDVSGEPIQLKQGWNQIGYNSLTPQPVEYALSSIAGHFDSVWAWKCDPTRAAGGYWMLYDPDNLVISDLRTLEPGMGLWVNAIDACTWHVSGGAQPAPILGHRDARIRRRGEDDTMVKTSPVPPDIPERIMRLDLPVRLLPKVGLLHQNYPNPFNPDTWIPYQLKEEAHVAIRIYTSTGQLVRTLNLGYKRAGFYTDKEKAAYWDGKNEAGEYVASGVYFYQIKAEDFSAVRKMTLLD